MAKLYSVVSSKPARLHFDKVKAEHADVIQGMADQSQRVEQYKQQKSSEMQSQETMKNDMDKAKMTANTDTAKMAIDFQKSQAEMDIKRASMI